MRRSPEELCISPQGSIRDAMARIDENQCGIVLVTDTQRRLIGSITDGDIRRAMLAGTDLRFPVSSLLEAKASCGKPIAAQLGTKRAVLLRLMTDNLIRQIPLLGPDREVQDLVLLDDLVVSEASGLRTVIMAGGFGKRLRPLTNDVPKPLLAVGDHPLMEWMVERLKKAGIRDVYVATHYKADKIMSHFGDGSSFGVRITYVNEDRPLGTGGALGLMPRPSERTLVVNGDILTRVDFRAMLSYHIEQRAAITVGVRVQEYEIPYGVLDMQDSRISGLREKPTLRVIVNAGIYLLEPHVYKYIPNGNAFSMTDLLQWLLDHGENIAGFPIREYWLDIGQHSDYVRAQFDACALDTSSPVAPGVGRNRARGLQR